MWPVLLHPWKVVILCKWSSCRCCHLLLLHIKLTNKSLDVCKSKFPNRHKTHTCARTLPSNRAWIVCAKIERITCGRLVTTFQQIARHWIKEEFFGLLFFSLPILCCCSQEPCPESFTNTVIDSRASKVLETEEERKQKPRPRRRRRKSRRACKV